MLSTRAIFIALGIFVAVALVGMRASGLWETRQRTLQAADRDVVAGAILGAQYSARTYDLADRMAEEVARRLTTGQMLIAPSVLHDYLAAQAEATSIDDAITIFDAEGRPLVSSTDLRRVGSARDATWFAALRDDGEASYLGPIAFDPATGDAAYTYSRRLTDVNGRFAGAVRVSVRPAGVKRLHEKRRDEPQTTRWTTNGRFVAATYVDFGPDGQAVAPRSPAVVTSGSASGLVSNAQETLGFAKVPGWPLVAVVQIDKSDLLASWRADLVRSAFLLLVLLFGVGALVAVGAAIAGREAATRRELEGATAALKAALADRELLVKEVHHRVRNSLQLTGGVLHLQARQFDDPAVRAAFDNTQRRLDSIAMVHEALYRGADLAEVDLAEYLRRLVGEVAHANGAGERGILVDIDVTPVMIAPEKATPVGLIVSEVMTNAFKHAFSEGAAGKVSLRLLALPSDTVEVCISDNGKGFSDEVAQQGLGSRLIRTLADQLGARSSAISDRGAMFRMVFPRT